MKILNLKVSKYWLIMVCTIGVLVGSSLGAGVNAIWSNVAPYNFNPLPWPTEGSGSLTLTVTATGVPYQVNLTAVLNPLPTAYQLQQNVTFLYNSTANANLQVITTVSSVNGVASTTFTSPIQGTVYFYAKIDNPI
jgi:hypothetical protein